MHCAYILLLPFASADISTGSFKEKLDLKILPKDYMLSSFNFKLKSDNIVSPRTSLFDFKKHNGFSRSIEPLLTKNGVKNLYIKFTKGHWDSQNGESYQTMDGAQEVLVLRYGP